MTEKEEERRKEKKLERVPFYETVTAATIQKRMRIEVPIDLKEPKTPGVSSHSRNNLRDPALGTRHSFDYGMRIFV